MDFKSNLRKAVIADTSSLAACIQNAYARYEGHIDNLPDFADGIEEDILNAQTWVLTSENAIIATLILMPQKDFLKLANLAVHQDHAGKGVGRQLLQFAEKEAQRQGYREIRLNTHVEMQDNIQLYQHLGWSVISRQGITVRMSKPVDKFVD